MTLLSLKELALRRIDHPSYYKKLKSVHGCPYDLIEPVLRHMTHHQLLLLEANTPRLEYSTQPLWKMHTLKTFPTVVETHDVDSADAEDADWRAVFHELQEERKEREAAARDRLKANYSQIASGKSDRKIQVIKKSVPSQAQIRASSGIKGANATRHVPGILGKAIKASMHASSLRAAPVRTSGVSGNIRPSPTASCPLKKSLPQVNRPARTSKFLIPLKKK